MTENEINEAVMEKACTGCKRTLAISEFNKNKRSLDGLDWKCRSCQRVWSIKWVNSEKGRLYRSAYRRENSQKHKKYKRDHRFKMALKYPEKMKARLLIGNAVRYKFIKPPIASKNWYSKYEFHHPDYSRPYYGCWLLHKDHVVVEKGKMECPPCIDYSEIVKTGILKKWGF